MNTNTVVVLAEVQCHKTLDQDCNCVRIGQFKHQEACGSRDQVCLESGKVPRLFGTFPFMHSCTLTLGS